jgi:hypothetical protein
VKCHTQKTEEMCVLCECGLLSVLMPFLSSTIARLVVAGFAQRVAEPLKTFIETITRGSTCRLDVLLHRQCEASQSDCQNIPMRAVSGCVGQVCQ